MKSADIIPGRYYRVRLHKDGGIWQYDNYVRVDYKGEPRYDGDKAIWRGTRFQLRGAFPVYLAARDIVEETYPDAKTLTIITMMEDQDD